MNKNINIMRSICPGCGLNLNTENERLDKDFNALAACRELYFNLSYFTLELHDPYFIHQLIVDAYAAQHSGPDVKPISTTFALVGLYLFNEKNYSGREVQLAHIELAKKSKRWPAFSDPQTKTWTTVQDVVQKPDDQKQNAIKVWNRSVWNVWKSDAHVVNMLQLLI